MSSDATTFPLRDALLKRPRTGASHGVVDERAGERADSRRESATAAVALGVIFTLGTLIVVLAANRPSLLSATSHPGFFPGWMAGPLGGLWPQFTRSASALRALFSGAMVLMYVSWIVAIRYAPRLRARWVIGTVIAIHCVLLLSPPLSLTDVFNYINYARMEVFHNLNPYVSTPVLEPHSDPSYYLSNWHQLLSPYGPLFTLITFAVVPLGIGGSFWALKVILFAASLGTLALVWRCAKLLGREPVQAIVFAGLNPIVLMWGLAGDHNDFLMVLLIMLGFYLLLRADASRELTARVRLPFGLCALELAAGVSLAAAVAVKASGAIVIPVVLAGLLHSRRSLTSVLVGLIGGGLFLAVCTYAVFGAHLPDLGTQGSLVTALSLPNLFGYMLGQGGRRRRCGRSSPPCC